jgi:acyl carrier protein
MDQKLKESIASELQVAPEALTAGCKLDGLENWDSVNKLTVMVILGDALGVPVDPGEIANLVTFGDIENLVASKQR